MGRGHGIKAHDEARILAATQKASPKPLAHWTTRRLAKKLGYSHVTITRVWKRAGIQGWTRSDRQNVRRNFPTIASRFTTP